MKKKLFASVLILSLALSTTATVRAEEPIEFELTPVEAASEEVVEPTTEAETTTTEEALEAGTISPETTPAEAAADPEVVSAEEATSPEVAATEEAADPEAAPAEEIINPEATQAEEAAPIVIESEVAKVTEVTEVADQASMATVSNDRYVSTETQDIVEPVKTAISSSSDLQQLNASSAKVTYYSQCAYQTKTGYDIIEAYVRASDGSYNSRLFFVYDSTYKEWLRYDYSKTAAEEFLKTYEEKTSGSNTLYIPVVKTSGGKKVLHSNISGTALDESKIPVIEESSISGINYAWKNLSDIPFVKDGSSYVYASVVQTDPDPAPTPEPVVEDGRYEATINGAAYVIEWTTSVQYDGRAHVWERTKVASKEATKKVADLKIDIYRNGAQIPDGNVSITYKNNTNVTDYAGKKVQPYFIINLKGKAYTSDSKKLAKVKMKFDIKPLDVSSGKFQAKKVVVSGSSTSFTNLYFVFADGRKVALTKLTKKQPGGGYTASVVEGGTIMFTGQNNFTGTGTLSLDAPKKITYEW